MLTAGSVRNRMRLRWKILGLAGLAGVAATGVVVRAGVGRSAYDPDELRARLHERLAEVSGNGDQAGRTSTSTVGPGRPSPCTWQVDWTGSTLPATITSSVTPSAAGRGTATVRSGPGSADSTPTPSSRRSPRWRRAKASAACTSGA